MHQIYKEKLLELYLDINKNKANNNFYLLYNNTNLIWNEIQS